MNVFRSLFFVLSVALSQAVCAQSGPTTVSGAVPAALSVSALSNMTVRGLPDAPAQLTLRDGAWVAAGSLITTPLGAAIAFLLSPRLAALLFGLLMFVVATNLIARAWRQHDKN